MEIDKISLQETIARSNGQISAVLTATALFFNECSFEPVCVTHCGKGNEEGSVYCGLAKTQVHQRSSEIRGQRMGQTPYLSLR